MNDLKQLESQLGYTFKNKALLKTALSHRSYERDNNERLEFLGDAVLGFIMADELYRRYPNLREGDMSRMRSALVNGEKLAELAKSLKLSDYLRLGMGELRSGGQSRTSILSDAMEAVIGAIYSDSGSMEVVRTCILCWYASGLEDLSNLTPQKDAKSALQEWSQARQLPLPHYEVVVSGEAHAQTFRVRCTVEGLPHTTEGVSSSRRKAEQQAAKNYLDLLDE